MNAIRNAACAFALAASCIPSLALANSAGPDLAVEPVIAAQQFSPLSLPALQMPSNVTAS